MKLSVLFFAGSLFLAAQDPTTAVPPTYDYDAATPGVQGPTSPLLAGYTYRSFREFQVSVPVIVPVADLQKILPAGFTAIPSAAGSTTTTVTLGLFIDQRFQPAIPSLTTYGPASALLVSATVMNNNVSPARSELVFPGFEAGADIPQLNAVFGAGAARLATVDASVTEVNGKLNFAFILSDPAIGFELTVLAQSANTLNTRAISDPVGLPFRAFTGLVPNAAFHASSQSDTLVVPATSSNLTVLTPGKRLYLPAGALSILGYGPNITFSRNVEFVVKFE